ncbi:MAG: TIGR02281 family clan AA aspartic protease [Candidatus Omnitrophica bacterium]|nr:TIGR02281 family clan AA aspartic protease [Candidatus Omnitrophota bacterium]
MYKLKLIILVFAMQAFAIVDFVYADILYLKNGRIIEGLVKSEDKNSIELDVYGGLVKFSKSEINKIERSSSKEAVGIRQKWERQAIDYKNKMIKLQFEEEHKPKTVAFTQDTNSILVRVTLNKKVEASLILDTGASVVLLRSSVAKKLGFDLNKIIPDAKVSLADGKQVSAKRIILDKVEAQGVEAKNVEAMVMLGEGVSFPEDGLLGMSFLNKFNFKIDQKSKSLILEKLY